MSPSRKHPHIEFQIPNCLICTQQRGMVGIEKQEPEGDKPVAVSLEDAVDYHPHHFFVEGHYIGSFGQPITQHGQYKQAGLSLADPRSQAQRQVPIPALQRGDPQPRLHQPGHILRDPGEHAMDIITNRLDSPNHLQLVILAGQVILDHIGSQAVEIVGVLVCQAQFLGGGGQKGQQDVEQEGLGELVGGVLEGFGAVHSGD
jgi:hypothetical protein